MASIEWDVVSIFEHVLKRVHRQGPLPIVSVRFFPSPGMNHRARLRDGRLEVTLSDLLRDAEGRVIEALATILLAKLYRHHPPKEARLRYRRYLLSREVEQRILETRRIRGRKSADGSRGAHYDLEPMFAELNARYFDGQIPATRLGWSRRATRTRMGHYDHAHRAIVVSRSLDRPEVPRLLVEYILYHEMLHVKHPVESSGGRRRIHGPAFRAEEKRFAGFTEVRGMLKRLALAIDVD